VEALEKEKSLDMQGIKAQFLGCPFNGSVGIPTTSTFFLAICAPFAATGSPRRDQFIRPPVDEANLLNTHNCWLMRRITDSEHRISFSCHEYPAYKKF
jgi:hypothetical protein